MSKSKAKITIFVIISAILFAVSYNPLTAGYNKITSAEEELKKPIKYENHTNIKEIKHVHGRSPEYSAYVGNEEIRSAYFFDFLTKDVFAVDNPMNYSIIFSTSDSRKIKDVVVVFGEPEDNYTNVQIFNVDSFVTERSNLYGDTIKLTRDPIKHNIFSRAGNIHFPIEMNMVLHFLTVGYDNSTGHLASEKPILVISPAIAKLQADTNRAILKQIDESQNATKSQDITNIRIEGLTWLTVGAIPLLLGVEILLRLDDN